MFRRGLIWLSIFCAPVVAACSLLLEDGLSGDDTVPNDSGAGSESATNGGDGSPNPGAEGGPTTDGSLPTLDGGKLVCVDAAGTFCDDFERDDPQGNWSSMNVTDGGVLTIEKVGANRRLGSAINAPSAAAQLNKDFTLTPTRLHIELTLEISSVPAQGNVYLAGAQMLNPGNPVTLFYIYARGGGAFVVEQLTDGVHYVQTALAITLNTPHRVVLETKTGGKTTVTVDGAVQVNKDVEPWLVLKPPTAILGIGGQEGADDVAVHVDDFVFIAD